MKTLSRLFRLWRLYTYMDFQLLTRSLTIFLTWYITDTVVNLSAIIGMLLLAERFDGLGPWSKPQLIFMLGYATIVSGVLDIFFGYNVLYISRRVGRGQLDHTLIQPQPIWMALLTEGFSPIEGSGTLIVGLVLLTWGVVNASLTVSLVWLALLVINLIASGAVVLAFSFLCGSLAFWAPRAAEEISMPLVRMFYQLKSFPLDGLSALMLGSLLSVIPVGLMAWYPSRYLLGLDPSAYAGMVTPLAAMLMSLVAWWAFRKGMKHYGRTGSQRYHALGHRS